MGENIWLPYVVLLLEALFETGQELKALYLTDFETEGMALSSSENINGSKLGGTMKGFPLRGDLIKAC